MARILETHARDPHRGMSPGRLRIHVAIHTVVETQLASGEPPDTRRALNRLISQGMPRHEAIHLIGDVVADVVMGHLGEGGGYDAREFAKRLQALEPPPADPG